MTHHQWIKNNSGCNGGKNFDEKFLRGIYDRVSKSPLKTDITTTNTTSTAATTEENNRHKLKKLFHSISVSTGSPSSSNAGSPAAGSPLILHQFHLHKPPQTF
jgi:Sec7-like guanine-nucleotide exchange factor